MRWIIARLSDRERVHRNNSLNVNPREFTPNRSHNTTTQRPGIVNEEQQEVQNEDPSIIGDISQMQWPPVIVQNQASNEIGKMIEQILTEKLEGIMDRMMQKVQDR